MDNLKEFKQAKGELEDTIKSYLNTFSVVWGCSIDGVDIERLQVIGQHSTISRVFVKVEI